MRTVEIQAKSEGAKGKVITVSNHKGGCGKTSLCFSLAANIYEQGRSVLLIDMDQQGSLGKQFNVYGNDLQNENFTLSRLYENLKNDDWSVVNSPLFLCEDKVAIFLGNQGIKSVVENLEIALESEKEPLVRFTGIIEYFRKHFDYIIIDTPPVIEKVKCSTHALSVSDCVVVPLDELDAVDEIDETMNAVITYSKKKPNVLFAFTKYGTDTRGFAHWFDARCEERDLQRCILPVGAKALKRRKGHDERRNTEYRFMRKVFSDNMCETGIPSNRDMAKHKYVGATEENRIIVNDLCKEILLKSCKGAVDNLCDYAAWDKRFALLKRYIEIERDYVAMRMNINKSTAVFSPAEKPKLQLETDTVNRRFILEREAFRNK